MSSTPNPGSQEALDQGCLCPVMDNGRGKGYMGNPKEFVYALGCPVHAPEPAALRGGEA